MCISDSVIGYGWFVYGLLLKSFYTEGSKMATGTQTQTAWALGIRDLAEMQETHLAEVKHQGELKLWHPEPLTHGRLLHIMIHWKNRQVATPALPPPSRQPARPPPSWPAWPPPCWPTWLLPTHQPNGILATAHHRWAPAWPDASSKGA
jgi:hypothetical protein